MQKKQAAILARVSTQTQEFEHQIAALTELAIQKGYQVLPENIYAEKISGFAKKDLRVELNRLESDVAGGKKIDIVFTAEISRIAREPSVCNRFVEELLKHKVAVYVKNMQRSSIDEFGKRDTYFFIMLSIISEFARTEAEYTKIRMASGKKHNFKEGRFIGGHFMAYGYKKAERDSERKAAKLIIDEPEAAVVREIFQMCIDGVGMTTIANQLQLRNIPTKFNKRWIGATISQILNSTMYYGSRSFKGEMFEGIVPAIITKETYDKAKASAKSRDIVPDRNLKYLYILKNKIKCGCCNSTFTPTFKAHIQSHYSCFTRSKKGGHLICDNLGIGISYIESVVWQMVKNGNGIVDYLRDSNEKLKQNKQDILNLEKKVEGYEYEISTKQQEKNRWQRMFAIGRATETEMIEEQDRLESAISTILTKLYQAKAEIESKKEWVVKLGNTKHYKDILSDIGNDRIKINEILQSVLDKVELTALFRDKAKNNARYYLISAFMFGEEKPIDTILFDKKLCKMVHYYSNPDYKDVENYQKFLFFDMPEFEQVFTGIEDFGDDYKIEDVKIIPFVPMNITDGSIVDKGIRIIRKQKSRYVRKTK